MSLHQNNDHANSGTGDAAYSSSTLSQRHHMQQMTEHEIQSFPAYRSSSKHVSVPERKLYAIEEQQEVEQEHRRTEGESADNAYDADVDDDVPMRSTAVPPTQGQYACEKVQDDKMHIYEVS